MAGTMNFEDTMKMGTVLNLVNDKMQAAKGSATMVRLCGCCWAVVEKAAAVGQNCMPR